MTPAAYPRELLEATVAERVAYFKTRMIEHPFLHVVDRRVMRLVRDPAGVSLVFVVGPTGVGKTTVRLTIEERLTREGGGETGSDPGRIPIVSFEAVAPVFGSFDWKDHYARFLDALDEPLVEHKVVYPFPRIRRDGHGHVLAGRDVATSALRRAVEHGIRNRRPSAVFIDEAQHFTKLPSGRRLKDQMDHIKSDASLTGTPYVLFGTYEVIALLNLSAQLSRRAMVVHFPRYRADRRGHVRVFQRIMLAFQRHLPVAREPDFTSYWAFCLERSVGLVGILKDWLTRALATALHDGASTVTLAHLRHTALTVSQCERIAVDIKEGERNLRADDDTEERLRTIVGLPNASSRRDPGVAQPRPLSMAKSRSVRRRRPGTRLPVRDPVGRAAQIR